MPGAFLKSRDYDKEIVERKRRLKRSRVPIGWMCFLPAPNRCHARCSLEMRPAVSESASQKRDTTTQAVLARSTTSSLDEQHGSDDKLPQHKWDSFSMQIPNWGSVESFAQFKVSMNAQKYRIMEYLVFRHFLAVTRSDMSVFHDQQPLFALCFGRCQSGLMHNQVDMFNYRICLSMDDLRP